MANVASVYFTTEFNARREPHIYLDARRWDDRGYKTLFDVHLHGDDGELRPLGTVKILQRGERETKLPRSFSSLPDSYCSLGQSLRYERETFHIVHEGGVDIRSALRDICGLSEAQRQDFAPDPGFEASLLRFASARFLYANSLGELPPTLRVDLSVTLAGFDAPHLLAIDLDPDRLLGRVAVIIGENGTGKTRFLDAVARALSGIETKWIAGGSPSVSRVIALSCNAFDQFLIPKPIIEDTYFYVGLRSRAGVINTAATAKNIAQLFTGESSPDWFRPHTERYELWREVMIQIGLESLIDLPGSPEFQIAIEQLGAGFKFACFTLTQLVRMIEPRSFVLFDEPENHTHPRLLSMMMRALHRVLDRFESFALVATHSPLVVQEVPARQVHVLRCFEARYPDFTKPVDETFGASLGELLRKTFSIDYQERNFDVLVRDLVSKHGAARVREDLGDELALSARLLLDKLDVGRKDQS